MNLLKTTKLFIITSIILSLFASFASADVSKSWDCSSGLPNCYVGDCAMRSDIYYNDFTLNFNSKIKGLHSCTVTVLETEYGYHDHDPAAPQKNENVNVKINGINFGNTIDGACNSDSCGYGCSCSSCKIQKTILTKKLFLNSVNEVKITGYQSHGLKSISISCSSLNSAPIAYDRVYITNEDTPVSANMYAKDSDGDSLTYYLLSGPSHGTLSGSGSSRTYTPDSNWYGVDKYTYRVSDGLLYSNTATVTITVKSVNDGFPVASDMSYKTPEDTPVLTTLKALDPDNDPITYSIVSSPSHGTLSGSGSSRTYTPDLNWNGVDTYTYRAYDGHGYSNTATVTITVTPLNDGPSLNIPDYIVKEDSGLHNNLVDLHSFTSDPDTSLSSLTYNILSESASGIIDCSLDNNRYLDCETKPDMNGFSDISVSVFDGSSTYTDTFRITVTPENDAPVALDISKTTPEDTPVNIALLGSDVDNDPVTYFIVSSPSHGTLSGSGSSRTYTPDLNWNGVDTFTYRVFDGNTYSNTATVTITVTPLNDGPSLNIPDYIVKEDSGLHDNLVDLHSFTSDPDSPLSSLTYNILSESASGIIDCSLDNNRYLDCETKPDMNGFSDISVSVFDGLSTYTDTFRITVTPENDKPGVQLIFPDCGAVVSQSANIRWLAIDTDGDILTINLEYSPDNGLNWNSLASGLSNTGSYLWDVSSLPRGNKYLVKVTAIDPLGESVSDVSDCPFTILPEEDKNLSVKIIADKTSGPAPLTVNFDSKITGGNAPFTYAWDFNEDGKIDSTEKSPKALFKEKGTYLVKLIVTDFDGDKAEDTIIINAMKSKEILPKKQFHINSINILNDCVKPGEELTVFVDYKNSGGFDIDDSAVTVIIPELSLRSKKGHIDLNTGEDYSKAFVFEIPKETPSGEYDLLVTIYDDGVKRKKYRPFIVCGDGYNDCLYESLCRIN